MSKAVSFTAPGTEFLADQEEIKRRQKMAEMLQAQADTPLQTNRMAGGYVVPISPLEGLSKMLQGGMAGYQRQTAEQKQKELTQRSATERQAALADALRLAQGAPESQYEDSMGIGRTQPAQKADLAAALQRLATSSDPALQQVGVSGMLQRFVPKESKWQVAERFNSDTGRKEKVLIDLNNPSNVMPLGGQEAAKLNFTDQGGVIQPRDPYTGRPVGEAIGTSMKPGETARLDWDKYQWGNASPLQLAQLGVDQARLANQGIQTQFETGRGVGAPMAPRLPSATPQIGGMNFAPTQNLGAPANQGTSAPQIAAQAPMAPQRPAMPQGPQGAPTAASGGSMVPPAMSGAVTPKALAARAAERPEATRAAQGVMLQLDTALDKLDNVLKAPGLPNITGPLAGRLPNVTGDATNAQASLDTLKSQIGVQVLNAMREASKTGGAVGNVTEKEWPILQNQLGELQQTQTTEQFKKKLADVKIVLERMKQNARQTYEGIYGSLDYQTPAFGQKAAGKIGSADDPLGIRKK